MNRGAERSRFSDEVNVTNIHSSATITHQTNLVEGVRHLDSGDCQFIEFFPLVSNDSATTKTSYWNNHSSHLIDRTSASCDEHHVQVGALLPCVEDR